MWEAHHESSSCVITAVCLILVSEVVVGMLFFGLVLFPASVLTFASPVNAACPAGW